MVLAKSPASPTGTLWLPPTAGAGGSGKRGMGDPRTIPFAPGPGAADRYPATFCAMAGWQRGWLRSTTARADQQYEWDSASSCKLFGCIAELSAVRLALGDGVQVEPGCEHCAEVLLDGPVEPGDLGAKPTAATLARFEVVVDRPGRTWPRRLVVVRRDDRVRDGEDRRPAGARAWWIERRVGDTSRR